MAAKELLHLAVAGAHLTGASGSARSGPPALLRWVGAGRGGARLRRCAAHC
jgi:hypothetical protein